MTDLDTFISSVKNSELPENVYLLISNELYCEIVQRGSGINGPTTNKLQRMGTIIGRPFRVSSLLPYTNDKDGVIHAIATRELNDKIWWYNEDKNTEKPSIYEMRKFYKAATIDN